MIYRDRKLNKTIAVSIPLLLIGSLGVSQESSTTTLSKQMLQDAYSAHLNRVRKMLPPHSGLPPLLDFSKSAPNKVAKDRAWESMFKGSMGTRVITDPGARWPSEATSVLTNFIDTVGTASPLPIQSCDAVVIGSPIATDVRISKDRTCVYSRFSLQVSEVLKRSKKADIQPGSEIAAVQIGGRIRFPSGHMETFILARHGFSRHRPEIPYVRMEADHFDRYIRRFQSLFNSGRLGLFHKRRRRRFGVRGDATASFRNQGKGRYCKERELELA